MNPMYDFDKDEIGFIQMGLMAIAQTTREAVEREGIEPPDGFVETLQSVVEKINRVIELRIENQNQFESLTQSLTDVENAFSLISRYPETPETIEYN